MSRYDHLASEIIRLAMDAIRFPTTADRTDKQKACMELFLDYFKGSPVRTDKKEFNGVPSAIIKPHGIDRPKVIICGHLDVVPGDDSQFEPHIDGDRLYGRGAMDMKGSLAAVAAVVKKTSASPPPWWLVIVSDEEIGGKNGAARLAREGLEADLFMVAEPSKMTISLQSKGALRLEIIHSGRSAHASTPWKGTSSVERMMEARSKIRDVLPEVTEDSWKTTACFSMVKGGTVINQVPDECRLYLDIRFVPGDDPEKITTDMRKSLEDFTINVLGLYPPMVCREDVPLVQSLKDSYRQVIGADPVVGREHGATDARYFADRMDALIFGPDGQDLHGPAEWVSIASLLCFADILDQWGTTLREATDR